jgi:hypothetical protein
VLDLPWLGPRQKQNLKTQDALAHQPENKDHPAGRVNDDEDAEVTPE